MKRSIALLLALMLLLITMNGAVCEQENVIDQVPGVSDDAVIEGSCDEPDAAEAPVAEVSDETHVEEPAEEVPAEEVPAEEVPAEKVPVEEVPAEEVPAEEVPAEEVPAEEVPAEEAPAEEVPAEKVPAEEVPAEEAPAEEVPAEEAPAEEVPAEEVPAEEVPAEEIPAEEVPAEEVPAEEVPAEEVPAEKAPAEEVPAEEVPAEEPAEEAPAEEAVSYRPGIVLSAEGAAELPVYNMPGGLCIATVNRGVMVEIGSVRDGWALIRIGSLVGYVSSNCVALYNSEAAPEETIRSIRISTNIEGMTQVREGTVVVLTATLVGFENDTYTLQWQYSTDGGTTAIDIGGACGLEYAYRISPANFDYMYRIVVSIDEAQTNVAE